MEGRIFFFIIYIKGHEMLTSFEIQGQAYQPEKFSSKFYFVYVQKGTFKNFAKFTG